MRQHLTYDAASEEQNRINVLAVQVFNMGQHPLKESFRLVVEDRLQYLPVWYFHFLTQVAEKCGVPINFSFIRPTESPLLFSRSTVRAIEYFTWCIFYPRSILDLLTQVAQMSKTLVRFFWTPHGLFYFIEYKFRTVEDFNMKQHLAYRYLRFSDMAGGEVENAN